MGLRKCPSCESRIEENAVLCPLCGATSGRCAECGGWMEAGAACKKCGKATAIRTRPPAGAAAAEAAPEPARMTVEADPLSLLPLLLMRTLLSAACLGAVVLAIAASPFGRVTQFVREHGVGPRTGMGVLWGAAAGFLLLILVVGSLLRRLRLRRTAMFGAPVKVQLGVGPLLLNLLVSLFVGPLTFGVALPWLHARFRQSFYRACALPGRGGRALGFQGRGEQVLGRFGLSLLLLPLGLASGGLLLGLVSWLWVKWEQSNLVVPDRAGNYRTVDFFGSFWAYQGRWIWGWLLSLLTLGVYRPWAKVSEWKWIAAHTQIA